MSRLLLLLASAALTGAAMAQTANAMAPVRTPMRMVAPDCWGTEDRSASFSGSMSTNGGAVVEQIGRRGRERVVQTSYGDLRVCLVTLGFDGEPDDRPSGWPSRSDRVILETRMSDDVRTLAVDEGRVTYTVNGAVQPFDGAARAWRDDLLGLLDPTWDLAQLRARLSALRGQISSIQGERSALQGQISSYRGQVSSMQGEISSLRGRVSAMQGEIAAIRGHESALRGAIASERAAISTLRGMSEESARGIDVDGRIRRHEDTIERLERRIRDYDADARVRAVERRIDAFDVETKVADVERRIRDFDVEAKVARCRRLLDGLGVDERVGRIEDEIRAMDEPARRRELEERRDDALARLTRTLGSRE